MGIFGRFFGNKGGSEAPVQPRGVGFVDALGRHLRGEVDTALEAYRKLMEEIPDDTLATFFSAAIVADSDTAEAAKTLRALSQRIAEAGDAISHTVALELRAQVDEDPLISVPAVANIVISFGDLLKQDGFVRECAVCFEISAELAPGRSDVLYKLGDTLHDLRIYDYAEAVLQEALNYAPNHWGALYTYAVLLQDLGRNEESLSYYEKANELNPDHANCQNNYGAALLRMNRPEDALEHCLKAEQLDGSSALIKVNLGNIRYLMREHEKAREYFTEALALNENLAAAYFGLASVERELKTDPARVKELFKKAIEMNPQIAEAHHALGNMLADEENPEALAHFKAAVELNENLGNLYRDFGSAYLRLGQREAAMPHFQKALQQNPDDVMVRELLGRLVTDKPV